MNADTLPMPVPRLPDADEAWTAAMRRTYEDLLQRHLALTKTAPPERLVYAWDAVANDYRELACVGYAAGDPLDRVRVLLEGSSRAHLELVRRRGADEGDANTAREYATGNACSTYEAICGALAVGDRATARALAPLVWDPPGAEYVGPNSVICTDERQVLAYALRFELLDDRGRADQHLKRLTRVTQDAVGEMLMMRGILETRPELFLDGLTRTLAVHEHAARDKANYRVAKYFLCLPALGLSALALEHGLVAREQLTADNVYLPRDLIAA
jgi:hypothetical protein